MTIGYFVTAYSMTVTEYASPYRMTSFFRLYGETFGLEEIAQAHTDQTKTLLRSKGNAFSQ